MNKVIKNNQNRKYIFKGIIISLIVLFIVEIYLVGSVTFNILTRRSLENNIMEVENKVAQLELNYLSLSNSINKSYASSLGFVDAENTIIVTRKVDRVAVR
ncbi:MAG: hypothetical protein U9R00_02085 [Patescibacteria group bacterium]|nr:hypothetical protein [Patescibacteria group bacterium]